MAAGDTEKLPGTPGTTVKTPRTVPPADNSHEVLLADIQLRVVDWPLVMVGGCERNCVIEGMTGGGAAITVTSWVCDASFVPGAPEQVNTYKCAPAAVGLCVMNLSPETGGRGSVVEPLDAPDHAKLHLSLCIDDQLKMTG